MAFLTDTQHVLRKEALLINSLQSTVAEEIINVHRYLEEQVLFLQPHDSVAITRLRDSRPSINDRVRLWFTADGDFSTVKGKAEIVGWDDKPSLSAEQRALIARIQGLLQPIELVGDFSIFGRGVNLIHVTRMQWLEQPFSVSNLITSGGPNDGKPVSENKPRPGRWSYVRQVSTT